jgi:hypothetical protein
MAGVSRTWIAIVAGDIEARADCIDAMVAIGAKVAVAAGGEVGRVETTDSGVAYIIGAGIIIITSDTDSLAFSGAAGIECGACIAIFAAALDDGMDATVQAVAGIGCARFAIVARCGVSDADSVGAVVFYGTRIAVITTPLGQGEGAFTVLNLANSHGARIGVLAMFGHSNTVTADTEITEGTNVAIVAGEAVGDEETSFGGLAGLGGTWVEVVAIDSIGGKAETFSALVGRGAWVTVVARGAVGEVNQ